MIAPWEQPRRALRPQAYRRAGIDGAALRQHHGQPKGCESHPMRSALAHQVRSHPVRWRDEGEAPHPQPHVPELFLSQGTVKTHVGRILAKLGLRDRVQAVVFAYETGLVQPGDATS